jgi:hypothetical protein
MFIFDGLKPDVHGVLCVFGVRDVGKKDGIRGNEWED